MLKHLKEFQTLLRKVHLIFIHALSNQVLVLLIN